MLRAIQTHIAKDLKADEVSRKEGIAEQTCLPLAQRLLKLDTYTLLTLSSFDTELF
jgi:hypothetical protein